jgi:rhodanese-related sulfurtransferase
MTTNECARKRKTLVESILFANLSVPVLDALACVAEEVFVPAGGSVVHQGGAGDCGFVIDAGKVKVFRTGWAGAEYEMIRLGPGESFGEAALLTGEPRPGAVMAVEDTHLLRIPKDEFDKLLAKHPELAAAVAKAMSRWFDRVGRALQREAVRQFEAPGLSWFDFALIIGLSVLFALLYNRSNPNGIPIFPEGAREQTAQIDAVEAYEAWRRVDVLFIDAMPAGFFEKEHIAGAQNVPLGLFDLMYMMALSSEDKARPVVVYGRTISRHDDEHVADKLALRGHTNIKLLDGGLMSWKKKGYPVEP